ncbi:hypothetical protein [Qipengyuania sp. ASV99]|uniref:hypothetical protein n=1 Tax=Qipengyuania sp. ASV99 TaxID=3399681 RepID=UPI003A4C7A5B
MDSPVTRPRLVLVYNADSGIINALMHAVHKQIFPSSYPCSLCAITYGAVSMRGEWRRFLDSLPMDIVIHHKDDFAAAFPGHGIALPAVLVADSDAKPKVLIAAEELDAMTDAAQLMERVEEALISEQVFGVNMRDVA